MLYAVVRVGSELAPEQVVGTRRAGLACLPAGRIRWSDVGAGSSIEQREAVQDALEDAELPVVPLGEYAGGRGGADTLRLRGLVKAASFTLCAKHWGIGDAKALSGTASLDVDWRVESRAEGGVERRHLSQVTRTIDGHAAAPLASIYRGLLGDAAKELAGWLKAPTERGDTPLRSP